MFHVKHDTDLTSRSSPRRLRSSDRGVALLGGTPKRWRDPVWSGGWWDPAKSVGYGTGIY